MKAPLSMTFLFLIVLASAAFSQSENETCLDCHLDQDLEGIDIHGQNVSMFVSASTLDSSTHAGMSCTDCHSDLADFDDYPHEEELQPVDCSGCHDEEAEIFDASAHGIAVDNPNAPVCASCHGTHLILPSDNPLAMTSSMNLPNTCSDCHHKKVLMQDPDIRIADTYSRYLQGVHARAMSRGLESSANCSDCHGVHDLRKASDPRSLVFKLNIPQTCSKCHNDVYIQYARGIHGKALQAGIADSPNCTDCHGEHQILQPNDPDSPVNSANLADFVCGKCHNDERLNAKYGMGGERFSSYQDSYHGLAMKGGSVKAASCASCHEAHDILPETNPASTIHPDNLTRTCGKCHPNSTAEFASSYTHRTALAEENPVDAAVRIIYIVLIVLVIGGMLLHNMIIFSRYMIEKYRRAKKQPSVRRFDGNMVYQHMILTISFIVLAITGFALKYPDAWWVGLLKYVGLFEASRSVIHRIAAFLLVYVSVHHFIWVFLARRGREEIRAILPNKSDLSQALQAMKYYLGMSPTKPRFGRYTYAEKAEYWALAWGTIIMAITGFILWFPTFYTSFLPAWIIKIAETIHFYEAWLATLAIAVWHMFFVMFHPDEYPMSFTWLNGKMTTETCRRHYPLWYDAIVKEKTQQQVRQSESEEKETVGQ